MKGSIAFVARVGFNPVYHNYLRVENSDSMKMVGNRGTDALGTDLMLLHVIAFVAQLAHFNNTVALLDKDDRKGIMKQILKQHFEHTFDTQLEEEGDWRNDFMTENVSGFDLGPVVSLIKLQSPFTYPRRR